jgi:predicted GNAT family N-acyltransferase
MNHQIEIIEYRQELGIHFKRLNLEWIEQMFVVEPSDAYVLSNPEEAIINKGGHIFFAKLDNEIIGTFALIKIDDSTFEIAKMAVTEKARGLGIGKKQMDTAIQKAKELKLDKLILYSHTKLTTALAMYFNYGFKCIPMSGFHNNRANIKMELNIKS